MRVTRRRRRSTSGDCLLTGGKVIERSPACFYSVVTVLDWAIVAFTIALGLWGYRQGLIVGALTLVGFGLGAFVGSRLGPLVLSKGSESPYAPLCAALGALLAGALIAVAVESFALGLRAKLIRRPVLHLADGAGGAALIAAVALGLAWVFGAVALHAPGTARLRADVQESLILRSLNEVLPPSGPVLNALDRVDPAPAVIGPAAPVARPDAAIATDPDVLAAGRLGGAGAWHRLRARHRGLRLGGEAGAWSSPTPTSSPAPTTPPSPPRRGGAGRDRGLLRPRRRPGAAATRRRRADRCRSPSAATRAPTPLFSAIPRTAPTRSRRPASARPGRRSARTPTGAGRSTARSSPCAVAVRSGNSGGPLVDGRGQVVGTVFAATTSGTPGGFAIPAEDVREALAQAGRLGLRPGPALLNRGGPTLTFSKLVCVEPVTSTQVPSRVHLRRSARISTPRSS